MAEDASTCVLISSICLQLVKLKVLADRIGHLRNVALMGFLKELGF
jgi:hypothetical protein